MIKKGCLFLVQLAFILGICKMGYVLQDFFSLPIPGNVIGMALLFLLLQLKVIKLHWIELASGFLVKHLAFFFIPIGVGLMEMGGLFKAYGIALLITLLISMVIGLIVSGVTTQKLAKKEENSRHEHVHHII
jgi:holin-like protein